MSRKTMFKKTVIAQALAVSFTVLAASAVMQNSVYAQSNATGTVFGQVASGAGSSIVLTNSGTGAKRTLTPDASGSFKATALPPGPYTAQLMNGQTVVSTLNLEVQLGQGSEISFAASKSSLQTIQVIGRREAIDVSNTNQGSSFTAAQLEALPVAKNVQSIIQLAAGTTKGDSRFGGSSAPSFGGAAASENSYYVNGYSVTNAFTQIGFAQLPFFSIANSQVLLGGYGAEFGRSIGGVVNITTKSGTNDWKAGISYSVTPQSLRATPENLVYPINGKPDSDGKVALYRAGNTSNESTASVYLSGPLITDKLFFFANLEKTNADGSFIRGYNPATGGTSPSSSWQEQQSRNTRSLVKLDWNITDDHHLEFTNLQDKTLDSRQYYGFDYGNLTRDNVKAGGAEYTNYGPSNIGNDNGTNLSILKYTGTLTDNLTVTALVGVSNVPHLSAPVGYDPSIYTVVVDGGAKAAGLTYPILQTTSGPLLGEGAKDETKGYRFDLEYKLGQHSVRVGLDKNTLTSTSSTAQYAGPGQWRYRKGDPLVAVDSQAGTPTSGGGLGVGGYYVRERHISAGGTYQAEQSAQYIEDRYQVTKDILLSLGLRSESYTNFNKDGDIFVQQKNQIDPRFGATWDVYGDATLKMFGNAGRYHLQIPTSVALRAAGGSIFTQQWYTYTGVDAKGNPTGLNPISGKTSPDNEFGQSFDSKTITADDLKANFQDEISVGFEKAWSKNLNVGAKLTYRKLVNTIDDTGDCRPIADWAVRNNVTNTTIDPAGYCAHIFNPGQANTYNVDFAGNGTLTKVPLSAADQNHPAVERTYTALDFFFEHPYRDGWYGKLAYTWSRNYGNTEGQLLSDVGQADVAATQAWDYPEFDVNATGRLPNDRTHQIKAFGYMDLTSEFGVGANVLLASGRPKNCIGNAPPQYADTPGVAYGSAFFFCNGVASPRGSQGDLPWDKRLDLSLTYKPQMVKGLRVEGTVFNVFNQQTVSTIDEVYNDAPSSVSPTYAMPLAFTAPRSVKLTVSYEMKF